MIVRWHEDASSSPESIRSYWDDRLPGRGRTIADRITLRALQLEDFPLSGRIVPEFQNPGIRELIETLFRILYRVTSAELLIIAIVDGRADAFGMLDKD